MRRTLAWVGAGAAVFASACSPARSSADGTLPRASEAARTAPAASEFVPQNVLLVLSDDMGVDMLRVYGVGTDVALTPNLDALARDGVTFRNVWANAVCSPTRATLLTGRYPLRTGIGRNLALENAHEFTLNAGAFTLPRMLDAGSAQGYAHAAIGKWHLSSAPTHPNDLGFAHYAGPLLNLGDVGVPPGNPYFSYTKTVDGRAQHATKYATTDQVDDALKWIDAQSGPWFLYLAFNAPHVPLHAPPAALHTNKALVSRTADNRRECYKAMIEAMDSEFGRLLAGLPQAALEHTTILFMADNGTPDDMILAPFDAERGKGSVYEEGIHVPLIVRSPLVKRPGSFCEALVDTSDVFATVAELAGIDLARDGVVPARVVLDSISFASNVVDSKRPSARKVAFSQRFLPNGARVGFAHAVPDTPFAQADVGQGGPGTMRLRVRGDYLSLGNRADLELSGAPAQAVVRIFTSDESEASARFGGTLVPTPHERVHEFTADARGELVVRDFVHSTMSNFQLARALYCQAVVADAEQPGGYQLSNAVCVQFDEQPNLVAVRDESFKLIVSLNGNPRRRELYDLRSDPLERRNVLPAAQGSVAAEHEAALSRALESLLH